MNRLILFDIDGTLLRCGPQVAPIFLRALEAVFGGYRVPDGFSFAGRTDPSIVTEMVRHLGFGESEIRRRIPRMRQRYVEGLD
ncbi:MAG: hypothetical protein MI919_37095, partial [Holophagales bacterium]|nr:hypothetical protein [Holophagales bacterium]